MKWLRYYSWKALTAVGLGLLPTILPAGRNFEYEYSLIVSVLSILVLPFLELVLPQPETTPSQNVRESFWVLLIGPLLVLLPGSIAFWMNLCPCSPREFRFWMVLQWYPSWLMGCAFGHLIVRLQKVYRLNRLRAAIVHTSLLTLGLITLGIVLWFLPQKRVTHFLAGFLHGPIYDEWIPVDAGIVWLRGAHALLACFILSLLLNARRWLVGSLASLLLAAAIFCLWRAGDYPSTYNGQRKLDELLPLTISTQDFTMHFTAEKTSSGDEVGAEAAEVEELNAAIERLYYDTIFHVQELKEILGVEPPHVHIYIYPDRHSMKMWFGGEQTDITDVHTPSIHITANEYPHDTLRHELVHALTSDFGFFGMGFHPNMAFTEGLAVALAPHETRISLDEGAAALIKADRLPSIEKLFSPLFWQESGARSYTTAGSIVKFLLQKYGIEKVRALYEGKTWARVFGDDRMSVIEAWRQELAPIVADKSRELQVNSLFRNPGILYDRCPHTKAVLRRIKKDDVWLTLRQPRDWDAKAEYWKWRLKLDSEDAYARLAWWTQQFREFYENQNFGGMLEKYPELRADSPWPPDNLEHVEHQLLLSDVEFFQGLYSESASRLMRLIDYSQKHYFGDALLRQVYARQILAAELSDLHVKPWRAYIAGWEPSLPKEPRVGEPWIVTYLRLRRGDRSLRSRGVLRNLLLSRIPSGLPPTFTVEWYKYIGLRLFYAGDYAGAEQAYRSAAENATSGQKAVFEEHERRMRFFRIKQLAKPEMQPR